MSSRESVACASFLWLAPQFACGPFRPQMGSATQSETSESQSETQGPQDSLSGSGYSDSIAPTGGISAATSDANHFDLPVLDMGQGTSCSTWTQDCPQGMKCTVYSSMGLKMWDATSCRPVHEPSSLPGESCEVFDNPWSGLDTCALGAVCWAASEVTLDSGVCVAFCEGSIEQPVCSSPHTDCRGSAEAYVCLPGCSPFLQDCEVGYVCDVDPEDPGGFACLPDESGALGGLFDACEGPGTCDPFLTCRPPFDALQCAPNDPGCCLPFCSTVSGSPCVDEDLVCAPLYKSPEVEAPPTLWTLGTCISP